MQIKSWYVAVGLFLFTVLTIFGTHLLFHDLKEAIIVGILVGVLGALFEVRFAIERTAETSEVRSREATERLIKYLRISDAFSSNEWLVEIISAILSLKPAAERNDHTRARCLDVLNKAVAKVKQDLTGGRVSTDNELERVLRLKEVVANSRTYVWAVSFDVNGYVDRFWDQLFGPEYVRANVETASRGVTIKRLFVISRAAIDGTDKEKHDKLATLMRSLKKAGKNYIEHVVPLEDLPPELQSTTTSFLLSDDYVASESNGIVAGQPVSGYISYGDIELTIKPLRRRFEQLELYAIRQSGSHEKMFTRSTTK